MLYLLQTIGLLAAAGIIFPVVIHLWNKKEGKPLRIGSVQLLVETARQQARSLQLKDLWLLLLRCLIILFLALLLAQPVWQKQSVSKDRKGWLVLKKPEKETYKKLLDSLVQNGFELHRFAPGFPILQPNDTAAFNAPTEGPSYWALLKALNEQVPADLPVYLITGNRLKSFNGSRPTVNMNLHWLISSDTDTTGNPVAARLLNNDSIETTIAHSTAVYTAYENKREESSANRDTAGFLPLDSSILRIAIVKDASSDAGYLEAAIGAIRRFGAYRITVETSANSVGLKGRYDWVFWLSQKELPAGLNAKNILRYENGKELTAASWMEIETGSRQKIPLQKQIESGRSAVAEMVWRNGFGEPILTQEKGATNLYHFYSRFDPAWNGLTWSETFPQVLFQLMLADSSITNPNDNRTIAQQQLLPGRSGIGTTAVKPAFSVNMSLSQWLWAVTFLLFALERFNALQIKKESHA